MESFPDSLRSALAEAWSIETSTKWRSENPALGQCSVTALVVQDVLGGDLLKTEVDGAWHFYNRIDGKRVDLSDSQFPSPVNYSDHPSDRDDAFADTSKAQYERLRERLLTKLGPTTVAAGLSQNGKQGILPSREPS